MRKFLLALFCLLVTVPAFADTFQYTFKDQTLNYYTIDESNCAVGENYEISGDVTIPEKVTYNGTEYNVTSIGEWAFTECTGLTAITIPEGVTSIGKNAFSDCYNLATITLPNSIRTIGHSAFQYCENLRSITLPPSISSIEVDTFQGCTNLKSMTIPEAVTTIKAYAFADCTSLTSIIIPDSVTSIGNYVFDNCSSLESVTIGSGLTSIPPAVFKSCDALTEVILLATVPPAIPKDANDWFYPYNCDLYVPDGSEFAYGNAFWWKEFASIQSETTSSPSISSESMSVKAENGNIIISNANGADIAIYDILGRPTMEKTTINSDIYTVTLEATGTFIVRVNHKAYFVKI